MYQESWLSFTSRMNDLVQNIQAIKRKTYNIVAINLYCKYMQANIQRHVDTRYKTYVQLFFGIIMRLPEYNHITLLQYIFEDYNVL